MHSGKVKKVEERKGSKSDVRNGEVRWDAKVEERNHRQLILLNTLTTRHIIKAAPENWRDVRRSAKVKERAASEGNNVREHRDLRQPSAPRLPQTPRARKNARWWLCYYSLRHSNTYKHIHTQTCLQLRYSWVRKWKDSGTVCFIFYCCLLPRLSLLMRSCDLSITETFCLVRVKGRKAGDGLWRIICHSSYLTCGSYRQSILRQLVNNEDLLFVKVIDG